MSKKIGIVLGSFHKELIEKQLEEVRKAAKELDLEIVAEVWVPGAVEKPLALKKLLMRDDIDGAVALGIIEKGSTEHGLTMGQSLMHFAMQLQLDFMKPIGLGVLGPGITEDQIESRLTKYARKAVEAVAQVLKNE